VTTRLARSLQFALERVFQGELNDPWRDNGGSDLVESRNPNSAALEARRWISELWVIEGVEELASELQGSFIRQASNIHQLRQRNVIIVLRRPGVDTTRQIPESVAVSDSWGSTKGIGIYVVVKSSLDRSMCRYICTGRPWTELGASETSKKATSIN